MRSFDRAFFSWYLLVWLTRVPHGFIVLPTACGIHWKPPNSITITNDRISILSCLAALNQASSRRICVIGDQTTGLISDLDAAWWWGIYRSLRDLGLLMPLIFSRNCQNTLFYPSCSRIQSKIGKCDLFNVRTIDNLNYSNNMTITISKLQRH